MKVPLTEVLSLVCSKLGLEIVVPFRLILPDGKDVYADAFIPELGGPRGMLIVSDYKKIKDFTDKVFSMGYGYSFISDPCDYEDVDIDLYRDMFSEWGWAGDGEKPAWMKQVDQSVDDE